MLLVAWRHLSHHRTHTVSLPPTIGWLLIAGGACALVFDAQSRKG
jgi:hypothetical protein